MGFPLFPEEGFSEFAPTFLAQAEISNETNRSMKLFQNENRSIYFAEIELYFLEHVKLGKLTCFLIFSSFQFAKQKKRSPSSLRLFKNL